MAFATKVTGIDKYTGFSYNGKPIVATKVAGNPVKKDYHHNSWVPETKKVEVATLWAALRDYDSVSELTKTSITMIRKWQVEPWFKNIVNQVIKDKNEVLDGKITNVLEGCVSLILDRLQHGEQKLAHRTGEIVRVPIDAARAATIVGILFDKRQLLRGEATSRSETGSYDRKLEELKEAFLKYSQASEIQGEIVNVDAQPVQAQQEEAQQAEAVLEIICDVTNGEDDPRTERISPEPAVL